MTIVSNSFYIKSIIVENTKEEQALISKEKSFQFKIKSELEIRIKNTRIINI